MLIPIKAGVQSLIELGPIHGFEFISHRLDPALCWASYENTESTLMNQ